MHDKDNNSNENNAQSTAQYSWLIVFVVLLGWSARIGKKYHAQRMRAKLPCKFCKYEHRAKKTEILYEDDEILIIKDKFPRSHQHFLALSKEHIPSVYDLKAHHYELITRMRNKGSDILEKYAPGHKQRFGFHRPPFNSVDHLHLHCLALPFKSFYMSTKYSPWLPNFEPVERTLKKLQKMK